MPVGRRIAFGMADHHQIAVTAAAASIGDDAAACRHHRCSDRNRKVYAFVHAIVSENWMSTQSKTGRNPRAINRCLHQHALGTIAITVKVLGTVCCIETVERLLLSVQGHGG